MLCKNEGCGREAFKSYRCVNPHKSGLCHYCYAQTQIDRLEVRPCMGGCGKRVHNIPYLVLEGITVGRGPGLRWCHSCARAGLVEPRPLKTGHCKACEKPMVYTKKRIEGYVRHQAHGLCVSCLTAQRWASRPKHYPNRGKYHRKLDEHQVSEIKHLLNTMNLTNTELARQYGVSEHAIWKIRRGKTWKYVKPASHAEIQ
jgi:transposase